MTLTSTVINTPISSESLTKDLTAPRITLDFVKSCSSFLMVLLSNSILFSLLLLSNSIKLHAEEINNNLSLIVSPENSATQGISTINITAGDFNTQANMGVIAVGSENSVSLTHPVLEQNNHNTSSPASANAVATINGEAFSNSSGWVGVNQISGQQNIQANIMAIGIGGEHEIGAVNDALLAQSSAQTSITPANSSETQAVRSTHIDDTALSGITGVVQLNQTAGARNLTSNNFKLQIHQ